MQLDQHLENKLFPQILCWSIAQVLGRTKAFSCESIFTIEHSDCVINAGFSADGKHLVTASFDQTAKICGLNEGPWQEKASIQHSQWVNNACLSADGKHLVTASDDNTAKICGLNDGQWQEKTTIKHDGSVSSVCFSSDGKYVMTVSNCLSPPLSGIYRFVKNAQNLDDRPLHFLQTDHMFLLIIDR